MRMGQCGNSGRRRWAGFLAKVLIKPWTTPHCANRRDGPSSVMTGHASPPVMAARSAVRAESGCEARRLPDHSHAHAALSRPDTGRPRCRPDLCTPTAGPWASGHLSCPQPEQTTRAFVVPAEMPGSYLALSAAEAASDTGASPAGAAAAGAAGRGRFEPCWFK